MFQPEDVRRIRGMITENTGAPLPKDLEILEGEGLRVDWTGGRAVVAAEDRSALSRGLFLLGQAAREGRDALQLCQARHFASCGLMLDCSRNAVPTVDAVRRLLDRMAMLGLNLLLLYTEDTYEVEGQPYHGYLRGRFTGEELEALDRYAAGYDIELMPCIQTLGHQEQFLQWEDAAPLRDRPDILLIDEPKVYDYIESALRSLRRRVRGRRIHIGMDEAHDVGLGRYLDLHGPVDRMELMRRHLDRVAALCRKYGFEPIIWSDMFFRLGSKRRDYYDPEAEIPRSVLDSMPDVGMCYWDYYHDDERFYERMLTEHKKLGKPVFAGGLWAWSGFLPQIKRTAATTVPAMRACLKCGMETVFATVWGDDGNETDAFLVLNQLPLLSEACWRGEIAPEEEISGLGETLTGLPDEAFRAFGEFYPDWENTCLGKGLIWCDPLYPLLPEHAESLDEALLRYRAAADALERHADRADCRYALLVFRTAILKAEWVRDARARYLAGDRQWLRQAVDEALPALRQSYEQLMRAHRALWERDYRRNGWEVLCLRYGGIAARLTDVMDELDRYLGGELPSIVELDEEPLPIRRQGGDFFHRLVTPMATIQFG